MKRRKASSQRWYDEHREEWNAFQREYKRKRRVEECSKIAKEAREEYCAFLKKYEGFKLADISLDELQRAEDLLIKAQTAEKKYMQLLGKEQERI